MLLFKNANIITMEDENFENGFFCVENGKIYSLGDMSCCPYDLNFDEIFDLEGKTISPGFIDAHCHVSLWEDGTGICDGNENTSPITPHIRAIDAINPFDTAFSEAKKAGITTMCIGPGSTNVLAGQFAVVKTDGKSPEDMLINPYAAQKASFGENPKNHFEKNKETPATRMAISSILRKTLNDATEYLHKKEENEKKSADFKTDFVLESLLDVIKGKIPLKCHVHRADDILAAIRIAEEFNIKISLEHCTEGHLIADIIKEKGIPVVLGPMLNTRTKAELKNMSNEIFKVFSEKNIPFAIMTDYPELPVYSLPICALLAVKYGVKREDAHRAITKTAAEFLGIGARTGSLKKGKDADFIITNGDPLELMCEIHSVYINGKKAF